MLALRPAVGVGGQPADGRGHVAGGDLTVVVVSSTERKVARVAIRTSLPTACPLTTATRSATTVT